MLYNPWLLTFLKSKLYPQLELNLSVGLVWEMPTNTELLVDRGADDLSSQSRQGKHTAYCPEKN